MKKWFLISLAVYAIVSVGLAMWFVNHFPARTAEGVRWALVCAIPAFLGLSGLDGIRTKLRERAQLVRAGCGQQPLDGVLQPFVGHMVGRGSSLRAPLSERECLLYHYEASHSSGGKSSSKVTDAEGYALAPASIKTKAGLVELRAYIELEFSPDTLEEEPSRERLSAYQRKAKLYPPSLDLMSNYHESKGYLLDDDGAICYDNGSQDSADKSRYFKEHVVQHGDEVVVFGLYSAVRRAIVPDPESEVMHRARLRKGNINQVARDLAFQAVFSGVVGVAFLAGAAWLFRLF